MPLRCVSCDILYVWGRWVWVTDFEMGSVVYRLGKSGQRIVSVRSVGLDTLHRSRSIGSFHWHNIELWSLGRLRQSRATFDIFLLLVVLVLIVVLQFRLEQEGW